MDRCSTGDFRVLKLFFMTCNGRYMPLYLSKLIEYITKVKSPEVKHGLWVITMCQCRFLHVMVTKC